MSERRWCDEDRFGWCRFLTGLVTFVEGVETNAVGAKAIKPGINTKSLD